MKRLGMALTLLLLPMAAGAQEPTSPGEDLPVRRHVLDNGMRFLVLERPEAPTVSFMVHYDVGSINERLGDTGIAHVLEHLLFKGTDEIGTSDWERELPLLAEIDAVQDSILDVRGEPTPDEERLAALLERRSDLETEAREFVIPNEFDRILSEAGARGLNATTSHEATRYFVELPANRLELWFLIESERMKRPVFREFYTEIGVVLEERGMRVESDPGGTLQTAFLATAFQVHPYGVPVIGHRFDLEALTRHQVADYFETYYGAQNAVVAIVGDVDADEVVRMADRYFSDVESGLPPPPVLAEEPEQKGERRVHVEFDAEPRMMIGWKAVSGFHPDAPALSMLAAVLTAGRTSQLYRRMVLEDRLATSVSAYVAPGYRDARLFNVSAVPRAPHSPEDLEEVIYEEIAKIQDSPPSEEALVRIRNQLLAGDYRRLESNFGLASQLADSESLFGDWRVTFRITQALLDVTPADVQRVAREYLRESTRTVATLSRGEVS